MSIKIFNKNFIYEDVVAFFNKKKEPFVIRNAFKSQIDLDFIKQKFNHEKVLTLNQNSDKEILSVSRLIREIKIGRKYRLRANTKLGNKIYNYIDHSLIPKIKGNKKNLFDYLLSFGRTSRQKTFFLSTKGCTFSKHAHVISGMIFQLNGDKTWHISKKREKFSSIKYKSLMNPNPLYVTNKINENEVQITLEPGDLLYMPAYWFHYTTSNELSLSFSYFFTENIAYYLRYSFFMFMYQGLINPYQAIIKSIKKEPEEHIFDREDLIRTCNKIKDPLERKDTLKFFKSNDYS